MNNIEIFLSAFNSGSSSPIYTAMLIFINTYIDSLSCYDVDDRCHCRRKRNVVGDEVLRGTMNPIGYHNMGGAAFGNETNLLTTHS